MPVIVFLVVSVSSRSIPMPPIISALLIIGGIAVVLKCKIVKHFIVIKTSIISTFSLYSRGLGPSKSPAKVHRHVLMRVPSRSYRQIYINKNSVEA